MTALVGQDLLDCVTRLKGASEREVMEEAGYAYHRAGGTLSFRQSEFYRALNQAQGIEMAYETRGYHREPTWEAKAGKKGCITLAAVYTKLLEIKPGDRVKIEQEDDYLIISKKPEGCPMPQGGCPLPVAV